MTQGVLLPSARIYGIDASSIMELDSAHHTLFGQTPRPPAFSGEEHEAIWSGLQDIAEQNRLRLLDKIREDLDRQYGEIVEKLLGFPHIYVRTNVQVRRVYQRILANNARLREALLRRGIEDADPYLVAAAKVFGWVVVSEEIRKSERKSRSPDVPIPDVCDGEGVECYRLRKVAEDEGWI